MGAGLRVRVGFVMNLLGLGRLGAFRVARARGDAEVQAIRAVVLAMALTGAFVLGACSRATSSYEAGAPSRVASSSAYDERTGTSASPRVVGEGQSVPRGGGSYKIGSPYKVSGRWYVPREEPAYDRTGMASWYGADFHGRRTANGEIFDMGALTAAHPTLPIPSYAYVTNLENGRTLLVRINDRGPYAHDRIIDMSRRSARELGFEGQGVTRVRVRYAGRAPLDGHDGRERQHLAAQSWHGAGRGTLIAAGRQPSIPAAPPPAATMPAPSWSPTEYHARAKIASARPSMLGGPQAPSPEALSHVAHVDLGLFRDREAALSVAARLEPRIAPELVSIEANGVPQLAVRIGPMSRVDADALAGKAVGLGLESAHVRLR